MAIHAPSPVETNAPLAPFTTYGIGGPAELLARPTTVGAWVELLDWARGVDLPVTHLGGGSNVLIDDEGIDGLTILVRRIRGMQELPGDRLRCEAGCFLPHLAREALRRGRGGWEFMSVIPGTVGAAVRINAALGSGGATAEWVEQVEVWDPREGILTLENAELEYAYRHSRLLERPDRVVLAAVLRLGPPEPAAVVQERMDALAARRKEKFPANPRNCGSVFRRADDGTPAAVHIDRAGCKGLRQGRCQVAPEHANWIVNLGGATAAEVRALIARLQDEVFTRFGVELRREVVYLPQDQKEIP